MTAPADGAADLPRCAARSLARDEALLGTASRARRWVLLEEPGPWGRTALRDSRLPDDVAQALRRLAQAPRTKVVLVRRPTRSAATTATRRSLVVASCAQTGGWVRGVELPETTGVLDLERELHAFVHDGAAPPSLAPDDGDPLLLVCTHGRHDTCCAELGRPLAAALAEAAPARTWEVSHIGGDRFAGNVVVLPDGLYLGRVPPALAGDLVATLRAGHLPLPYLRGRSTYGVTTQAAEVFARQHLGATDGRDLSLVGHDVEGDLTSAAFRRLDGSRVVARVRGGHRDDAWLLTCSARRTGSPHEFVLESVEELPADPTSS